MTKVRMASDHHRQRPPQAAAAHNPCAWPQGRFHAAHERCSGRLLRAVLAELGEELQGDEPVHDLLQRLIRRYQTELNRCRDAVDEAKSATWPC